MDTPPILAPQEPVTTVAFGNRRRHTLAVLGTALGLRLLVLADVIARYPKGWFFTRGIEMQLLAQSLLGGRGLASPFGGNTGPTAFIAPVYPILVAAVFRVLGTLSVASAVLIMSVQILLALLAIYLILRITRELFGEAAAVIAGLIWACSPPLIWIPTIFWETSISICLLLGLIVFALRCQKEMSRGHWIGFASFAALTGLVNPALLLAAFAVAAWLALHTWKTARTHLLFAAFTFALVFSPWPIRNARVFHAFIPTRTTVGYELWMGNRPGATGYLDQSLFPMYNRAEFNDYIQRGEIGYTQHKTDLAHEYIREHPGTFVTLTAKRVLRFWRGTGSEAGSPIFSLYATLTSVFGFAGLWLLWERNRSLAILFALPMLLFPLPYYITHAEIRYRLLLDPVLTILAAGAIMALLRRVATEPVVKQ